MKGIDPRLDARETLSWILEQLEMRTPTEAERAGEPLLVFASPARDGVRGYTERLYRIVGDLSGVEHVRLTLGWRTDTPEEVTEAERFLDAYCRLLHLGLNGHKPTEADGEALGILLDRPLLRCRHCDERCLTVAQSKAHQQSCDGRRRALGHLRLFPRRPA